MNEPKMRPLGDWCKTIDRMVYETDPYPGVTASKLEERMEHDA